MLSIKSEYNDNVKPKSHFRLSALAFTLAEVLITLGIIGIVAEMTIPTLMNNVESGVERAGLKKSFSVLSQAYLSLQTDNNGSIVNLCAVNDSDCLVNAIKPYLRYTTSVSGTPNATNLPNCWNNADLPDAAEPQTCLVLNDGTTVSFDMEWSDCTNRCALVNVDVNGLKKPNKWGKDRYGFAMYVDSLKPIAAPTNSNCNDGSSGDWSNSWACASIDLYK